MKNQRTIPTAEPTHWLTYIDQIESWQRSTQSSGKPPVAFDKKLSNWLCWATKTIRDNRKKGAAPHASEPHLIRLGIIEPADTAVTTKAPGAEDTTSLPRGIEAAIACMIPMVQDGRIPTLFSADPLQRHLALWVIRMQAGILGDNHLSRDSTKQKNKLVDGFIALVNAHQSVGSTCVEWIEFCRRLDVVLARTNKGDGWHSSVASQPVIQNSVVISSLEPRLNAGRTLRHPVATILTMNSVMSEVNRPVVFSHERPQTVQFARRLQESGCFVESPFERYSQLFEATSNRGARSQWQSYEDAWY